MQIQNLTKINPVFMKKINFAKLLVEVLSIVFSVLLALSLNEWMGQRKERKEVQQALQSISNELTFNQNFLKDRLIYYSAMRDTLAQLIAQQGSKAAIEKIPGYRGLNPVLLRNSSYQVSIASQVFPHIKYELAERIALIYAIQDFHIKGFDKFLDTYMQVDQLGELHNLFSNWVQMSEELIRAYGQIKEVLPPPNMEMRLK